MKRMKKPINEVSKRKMNYSAKPQRSKKGKGYDKRIPRTHYFGPVVVIATPYKFLAYTQILDPSLVFPLWL